MHLNQNDLYPHRNKTSPLRFIISLFIQMLARTINDSLLRIGAYQAKGVYGRLSVDIQTTQTSFLMPYLRAAGAAGLP